MADQPPEPPAPSGLPAAPTGIPAAFAPVVSLDAGFDSLYGLEMLDDGSTDGVVRGRVAIDDRLRAFDGRVHGGVISALAEALASRGTWMGAGGRQLVMGMSNETSFLAPLRDGYVHGVATPRHRSPERWLWEVQSSDDQGRLCAVTIVSVAVRPAPAPR